MLKKLLYLALPIAALAVIGLQTASADYYDCEGNIRPGTPGPSQCHYLTVPPSSTPVQPEPVQPQLHVYKPQLQPLTVVLPEPEEEEVDEVDIKNSRKYCVRDYCYLIYEVCYSNGYCEQKAERIDRDDYYDYDYDRGDNYRGNHWQDSLNNYVYNYFQYNFYNYGNRGHDDCDYRDRDCVYRGTYYGRYHNRYWDF